LFLNEAVESETIQSSILRHKLSDYPRDIQGEIRGELVTIFVCYYMWNTYRVSQKKYQV